MRLVRTQATGLNLTLRADTPEEEAFLQHLANASDDQIDVGYWQEVTLPVYGVGITVDLTPDQTGGSVPMAGGSTPSTEG